ncbi:hypothetical protein GCM10023212_11850 [Luteolibacter yonseiensis]
MLPASDIVSTVAYPVFYKNRRTVDIRRDIRDPGLNHLQRNGTPSKFEAHSLAPAIIQDGAGPSGPKIDTVARRVK